MKPIRSILVAVAALLILAPLAACSEGADPTVPDEPVVEEVSFATEAQVASVIAKYEPAWREVLDSKSNCRLNWDIATQIEDDLIASLDGMTCMTRIHTMTVTARTALTNLEKLDIPPSMQDLVDETTMHLEKVANSGVSEACDMGGNAAEPECDLPMLTFEVASMQLESSLNAWAPYL